MKYPFAEEDIIRFIRGEMTGSKRIDIEKEIDSNQAFANEVGGIKQALIGIDRKGEQMLKSRFKHIEKKNLIKKWVYIFLATISVIVLGLAIKKSISKDRPMEIEAIYAENFQKYRPPVTIRNNDQPKSEMTSAIEAYNTGNYEEAFKQFDLDCNYVNQEACFYAVLSAIYGDGIDYQKANNTITADSPYTAIILWNEALFDIKMQRTDEAIIHLEKLLELGSYKKTESLEILKILRNLKK